MAMVEYDRYLPEVRGDVQDCPEIIVLNEIRNTIIDFCQKTTVWRKDLDAIAVAATVCEYDIDVGQFEKASAINWAYLLSAAGDEIQLTATSEDSLDNGSSRSSKLWRTKTGTPSHIYLKDPTVIRLVNIPTEAYTLYAGVIVKPSRDSYEAPDYIYEKYLEAIAAGAKARILGMKSRPWYAPEVAMMEELDYKARRSSALIDSTKSHTRTSKSVEMRPLA